MDKSILQRIIIETNDAKEKVSEAMQIAREKRGVALNDNAMMYALAFKDIEYILKQVLED